MPAYADAALNPAEKWQDNNADFYFLFLGGDCLPTREFEDEKRKRQYEHIKESELARGASEVDAERIAAATVNKTRREKGET